MAFRRELADQLPRLQPWTAERIIALVGALAGIAALFITYLGLDHLKEDQKALIFISELSLLSLGLLAYIFFMSRKKLHRFAQSVIYIHYINHILRDQIASMEAGKNTQIKSSLQDIVNAAAHCFSVLTARRCRVCIQEVLPNRAVQTVVRDSITSTNYSDTSTILHTIEDNTDYDNIWYGKNGCPRYFLARNIVALWRSGAYRNSSFGIYGQPKTASLCGISFVTKWTLPYKATIVLPIRYIPENCKWPTLNIRSLEEIPVSERPFIWGFICIDCASRNTFDDVYFPELGAAIADAIFIFLSATWMNLHRSSPTVDGTQTDAASSVLALPHSVIASGSNNLPAG